MCDIRSCSVECAFRNVDYIIGCKNDYCMHAAADVCRANILNAPCVKIFAILCLQRPCLHKVSAPGGLRCHLFSFVFIILR